MIRHVVTCQFTAEADPDEIETFLSAIGALRTPGLRSSTFGLDLGLRDGNANYALVADFDDVEAYQRYDADPEHQRIRASIAGLVASATRAQFELDG